MSPEAQRIEIALACVWTDVRYESNYFIGRSTPRSTLRGNNHKGNRWEIPDYPTDLNACREFEIWLLKNHPDLRAVYRRILIECVGSDGRYWMATAAQRCEAFLKTIGKWEAKHES